MMMMMMMMMIYIKFYFLPAKPDVVHSTLLFLWSRPASHNNEMQSYDCLKYISEEDHVLGDGTFNNNFKKV